MKCAKCSGEVTFPSLEGLEKAADAVLVQQRGGRGTAAAYLWMVAGCMRGVCLTCQPVTLSERTEAVVS